MAEDYTPTTGEVRATFRSGWTLTREGTSAGAGPAFNRWLIDHDRQVAAQALRDAADEVDLDPTATGGYSGHRNAEAAAETWLRARADTLAPRPAAPGVSVSAEQMALTALSRWIDAGNADRDPEALHLHRVIKVGEEAGEVVSALIGWLGANPRKGQTHSLDDVIDELLDVAVTALGAIEHLTEHDGTALHRLAEKILRVAGRVSLTVADEGRAEA